MREITVVGGGFAGCEAAWSAANLGVRVRLFEMRPAKETPAHKTPYLAELVCSNSFKSMNPDSPAGQLKAEMSALGSLMISTAIKHQVPGGEALAVERDGFAREMTGHIESHPNIEVIREEWTRPDSDGPIVIATGPLTSEGLSQWLKNLTGSEHLHFYDAVSPIVEASSVDLSKAWLQSRYDKGEAAYINCPFTKEIYDSFVEALLSAEQAPLHDFEPKYFEGCMPIEEIARRGIESLRFGNFKPVGLTNPHTAEKPYAVLQLRPENREATLYSLVACQTRMKWGAQKAVLGIIPGLENAEFVRYGVIHRNTYLDSPQILEADLSLKAHLGHKNLFFAGQITGVEGYVESGAIGILAGINAARRVLGLEAALPPRASALGCLVSHLTNVESPSFAPMNINWGIFPDPEPAVKDKALRKAAKLDRARAAFQAWHSRLSPEFTMAEKP